MLTLPASVKIYLAAEPVDARKSFDGLSARVDSEFGLDPLSGSMHVLFSKRRDRVRVLYYDRDGYVLVTKRLAAGRFAWPVTEAPGIIAGVHDQAFGSW